MLVVAAEPDRQISCKTRSRWCDGSDLDCDGHGFIIAVVRGSSLLLVALVCTPTGSVEYASVYAEMLEHVVARLLDDLERDFLGGRRRGDAQPRPPADEARVTLRQLCASAIPTDQASDAEERLDRVGSLLVRADMVLEALAREHGHEARRVLPH